MLAIQPEANKRILKSSPFFKESRIAVKSGLFEKFWDLSEYYKAWLIAVIEEQELLQEVIEHVAKEGRDKNTVPTAKHYGHRKPVPRNVNIVR